MDSPIIIANEFSLLALEAMCLASKDREVLIAEATLRVFPMKTFESVADLFEEIEFELDLEFGFYDSLGNLKNG